MTLWEWMKKWEICDIEFIKSPHFGEDIEFYFANNIDEPFGSREFVKDSAMIQELYAIVGKPAYTPQTIPSKEDVETTNAS